MPFKEAMLGSVKNVICMQLVNYYNSNNSFRHLIDNTCEGDWSVILYVTNDAFL